MIDLYNEQYDRQTLKENIYSVKLMDIVKTQMLDITFIVRYILNKSYQLHEDDKKITINDIIKYQPHITEEMIYKYNINYDSDEDSVEDFESVSNRN